jgi:hypothetical protein
MAKRKVIWLQNAKLDMFEIMHYYSKKNKSKTYSLKLYSDIKFKLNTLDFSIAMPQSTSVENLFYFTHNHISVCFTTQNNNIIVKLVIDDRRNPSKIKTVIKSLD